LGQEIHAIYYDDKADQLIVGGNPIDVNIWDINTGENKKILKGIHTDSVTCMTMDGYFLFTGSDDHTIVIWNLDNYSYVDTLSAHKQSLQYLMMLSNGFLVSCAYDHKIHIWDYTTGEIKETLKRKKEEFKCMDVLEESNILLAGTNDKNIVTFNIEHILAMRPEVN